MSNFVVLRVKRGESRYFLRIFAPDHCSNTVNPMFIRLLLVIFRCLLVGMLASLPALSFAQEEEEEEVIHEETSSESEEEEADTEDNSSVSEYPILGAKELLNAQTYFSIEEATKANPLTVYKLSLRDQDLKELPEIVRTFSHLQVLDLSSNKLKELPTWFSELNRIEQLNLYDNRLTSLPNDLSSLTLLNTLYLGNNRLTEIPVWVGGIGRLQKLDVSGNGLTAYELSRLISALPRCEISY